MNVTGSSDVTSIRRALRATVSVKQVAMHFAPVPVATASLMSDANQCLQRTRTMSSAMSGASSLSAFMHLPGWYRKLDAVILTREKTLVKKIAKVCE